MNALWKNLLEISLFNPWYPFIISTPNLSTNKGSSPKVSNCLENLGSIPRSSTGEKFHGILERALQGTGEPNYDIAFDAFSNSLRVNPEDTLGLLYGGYVAEQLKKYDDALSFYEKLMSINRLNDKNTNTIYQNSINILYQNCSIFTECCRWWCKWH